MDTVAPGRVGGRSRWRAYLVLSRLSNLPTVWSNVLAGVVLSGADVQWFDVVRLGVGVSLLYVAGMFLNDAFDRRMDAVERPDRPIPAGDVGAGEVFFSGFAFMALGLAAVSLQAAFIDPLGWTVALVAAIVLYDMRHKKNPLGPLMMGVCRALVYCVAAAAVAGTVSASVFVAAAGLGAYVVGLTEVAKRSHARAGIVPYLIAGISLFDAAMIALNGGAASFVLLAALGFPLTLLSQRIVSGT